MQRLLRIGALAALAGAIAVPAASAADWTPIAGSFVPTSAQFDPRPAGSNVVFDASGTHTGAGSLAGTSTIETHFVIHDATTLTYQGFATFVGTTPCGSAMIRLNLSGGGPFPGPVDGHGVSIGGGSVDVRLDTVLFLTPAGAVVAYTGEIRCG